MNRPYVLGLTGNIATGKSLVAHMLAELGAEVIDCDLLTHEVMAPGTPVNAAIAARFPGVQRSDGSINRAALGRIVFANPQALAVLEAIVHPEVITETWRRVAQATAPVVVVEAIKLFETGMHLRCDAVWVVSAAGEVQLDRLTQQRGMSFDEAEQRIMAQPDPEEKLARADLVIENSGSLKTTRRQVVQGWQTLPVPQPVHASARPPRAAGQTAGKTDRGATIFWGGLALACLALAAYSLLGEGVSPGHRVGTMLLSLAVAGVCGWMALR